MRVGKTARAVEVGLGLRWACFGDEFQVFGENALREGVLSGWAVFPLRLAVCVWGLDADRLRAEARKRKTPPKEEIRRLLNNNTAGPPSQLSLQARDFKL